MCLVTMGGHWPRTNTCRQSWRLTFTFSLVHLYILRGDNHPDLRHGCVGLLGRRERGAAHRIENWSGAFSQSVYDQPSGNNWKLQTFFNWINQCEMWIILPFKQVFFFFNFNFFIFPEMCPFFVKPSLISWENVIYCWEHTVLSSTACNHRPVRSIRPLR